MLAKDLPFEIQWKILGQLGFREKKIYSVVCKQWREVAKYAIFESVDITGRKTIDAFIDTVTKSPSKGEIVKKIMLYVRQRDRHVHNASQYEDEAQKCSTVIRLTPNVREFRDHSFGSSMFKIVLQEIQNGHWKHLSIINEVTSTREVERYSTDGYHSIISALRDRLSTITLDVTSGYGSDCFQNFRYITRETRFNAAKSLRCFSDGMAAIESLDDVFALCPNATEIKLELHDLGCGYHTLTHFEPNTTVEILDIELYDPREANLKYLCQKFPNVKELVFSVKRFEMDKDSRCSDAEFINPLWMSAEAIAFLLNYAHSREKFCMTLGLLETIEPFLATSASLRWQGEMTTTCYRDEEIWFIYDRFKPQKLHLSFKNHVPRFETSQITSMKAYLNQLDELDIENNPYLKLKQLMTHCTSLRALKWHLCSENTYEGPVLPITHLTLLSYDSNRNRKFLKQLHSFMPNLRDLILCTKFLMESEIEIDLSSACLQSFCINSKNDKTWLYLHLVRSGEDTYYCRQNTQPRHMSPKYSLQQIEGNEYGLRAPTCSRLHMGSYCGLDVSTYTIQKVKIICKDIKRLEVRGHSNRHDIFDFPKPMTTEDFSQRVSLSFYN